MATRLTFPFFPHGLGHFLGLQVHDVAGRQADRTGTPAPPPSDHPALRTVRPIEERMLFTVEPGLYFIPMLLDPVREGPHRAAIDWALVDRLVPDGRHPRRGQHLRREGREPEPHARSRCPNRRRIATRDFLEGEEAGAPTRPARRAPGLTSRLRRGNISVLH